MTKLEQAAYLVALISIMESKEGAGNLRGKSLAKEYEKTYDDFVSTIRKEHEDETRKRELAERKHEDRAAEPRSEPRSGQPLGEHGSPDDSTGSPRIREGLYGANSNR